MKNLSQNRPVNKIHMTAICGMGMGSLAGLLKEKGYEVSGSDANIYPPMSDQLARLGIPVQSGYRAENLVPRPNLVVIGNAVSRTNPEVEAVLQQKIPYLSMPQALEELFLKDRLPIVVAGTHGKTTTSALLAWILERSGRSPGFLVGGILNNFEKSYGLGRGELFVIEGDEYDSAFFDKEAKFFHYHPHRMVLNPVEFDHADIYRDLGHLMDTFRRLIHGLPGNALLAASGDSPNVRSLIKDAPCRVVTFGTRPGSDLQAQEIQLTEESRFELIRKGERIGSITSPLMGRHNIQNLLGVIAIAMDLGISHEEIQTALSEFKGVRRRQEIISEVAGVILLDDFAHHPTAIRETLRALRGRYRSKRIWVLFEPRSNTTRRKIFQDDFSESFKEADEIIIAPVYLEEKIAASERLDTEKLVRDLNQKGQMARAFPSIDAIVETIVPELKTGDIVCLMSNGSFGGVSQKIQRGLEKRPK